MSNSRYAANKTQSVLVFDPGLIQKIDDTTIYAEKMYSTNFTVDNKRFCLSCIITMTIAIYLSIIKKLLILKPKILKLCHIRCV